MSTVYVVGAGASHGEFLKRLQGSPSDSGPLADFVSYPPPMTRGFFDNDLLDKLINPQSKCEFEQWLLCWADRLLCVIASEVHSRSEEPRQNRRD
jgi:hypothetical protein